jgi:hypothetical protein
LVQAGTNASDYALNVKSQAAASLLIVEGGGNVGMGYATPSFPLSLGQTIGNKIALYDVGSGTGYGFGTQSNILQIFVPLVGERTGIGYGNSASFTETLSVKGSTVGILNTNPTFTLDISGTIRATASSSGTPIGTIQNTNSTAGTSNGLLVQAGTNSSDYALDVLPEAGGTPILYVRGDGNVGIGTGTPITILHLSGTLPSERIQDTGTAGATAAFIGHYGPSDVAVFGVNRNPVTGAFVASGKTAAQIGIQTGTSLSSTIQFLTSAVNGAAPGEIMRIAANVLMGTTSDNAVDKLQVNGSTLTTGIHITAGSNTKTGSGTLVGGTLAVANTSITANSKVFVQDTSSGVLTNVGSLVVSSKTAGTGFTVKSTNVLDTSSFDYFIIETA